MSGSSESVKDNNLGSELPIQNIENILKPLSNPSRQHLLILLANGPLTYTEILENMGIESGSFYWHIGKMKLLVQQTDLKEYHLSDLGKKAYDLLVYDNNVPPKNGIPFRPDWYVRLYKISSKFYHLPTWIILQQVIIILALSGYLFNEVKILQILTLPFTQSVERSFYQILLSVIISNVLISMSVLVSQIFYIRPDREHFKKSLFTVFVRISFGSSLIMLTGLTTTGLIVTEITFLANNPIVQLILSMFTLIITIFFTTLMVDHFLDLGLKDALLIVLPPYYVLILISFFVETLF